MAERKSAHVGVVGLSDGIGVCIGIVIDFGPLGRQEVERGEWGGGFCCFPTQFAGRKEGEASASSAKPAN